MSVRDVPESWHVTATTPRFGGRVVRVRTDQIEMPGVDGPELVERDYVEHPGAVAALALDADDRVLLIRQYRHPARHLLWELPAGLRDVDGEPIWKTAERELAEEAGFQATEWYTLIDLYTSPGMSNERIRIFLARGLTEAPTDDRGRVIGADGKAFDRVHEEADMPIAWVPLDEAVAAALRGDLHNLTSVAGVLAAHAARATGFGDLRPVDAPEP